MKTYLYVMGIIMCAVTLLSICMAIGKLMKDFKNKEKSSCKYWTTLYMCISLVIGSGLSVLFFQVANLSK